MARRKIPLFTSEAEEQSFWANNDSTDLIDWSKGNIGVFPNLKPSTRTISLRLPESLLSALKVLANKRDVPYQSLMKVFLSERLNEEFRGPRTREPAQAVRSTKNRSQGSKRR
jgi:predicted DNA binding CopG/RHH family protein